MIPQQLFPAGVVGMIGTANDGPVGIPTAVTSYRELTEIFGQESLALHSTRRKKCISERCISSSSDKSGRFC